MSIFLLRVNRGSDPVGVGTSDRHTSVGVKSCTNIREREDRAVLDKEPTEQSSNSKEIFLLFFLEIVSGLISTGGSSATVIDYP